MGRRPSSASGDPFRAEARARRDLEMAWHAGDYAGIARIAETLRVTRSAIREMAVADGGCTLVHRVAQLQEPPASGCVLVTPPLVGIEGRGYRDNAWGRRVAVLVVTREPRTDAGLWPVVAVEEGSYRAYVEPPAGVREAPGTMCRDELDGLPESEWFLSACAAIGRAILAKVAELEHPAWRTDDLIGAVLAHPDDDALHDALADAALKASRCPPPEEARPDGSDPFCF